MKREVGFFGLKRKVNEKNSHKQAHTQSALAKEFVLAKNTFRSLGGNEWAKLKLAMTGQLFTIAGSKSLRYVRHR